MSCHQKTSVKKMKSVAIDARFQAEVQQVVCAIPPGWVLTYGHIARLIGHPQHARQVGLVLKKIGEAQAPCHRVVNSSGRLAPMWDEQGTLLRREGVTFKANGCVDLRQSLWHPDDVLNE